MANLIQIKRSLSSATPPALANGELAYTAAGDVLFIGSGGAVLPIGGKRTPGVLTANQSLVANATGYIDEVRVANAVISKVYANGTFGAAGQVLTSNSTGVYWSSVAPTSTGTVTQVNSGSGLTGGPIVDSGTLSILANSGISANSTGVYAVGANGVSVTASGINVLAGTNGGLVSNTTGVFVTAGSGLLTNSTGVHVGTGNGIAVDADSIRVTSGPTIVVNATGVHVNSVLSITDLNLSGNLAVSGTLTTVDTQNLAVNDSIIELARNNAANILDIGLYGQYNDGVARYTGLIWDVSGGVYELFSNTTVEPTTTLDTAGIGYTRATLRSFLNTGAFVASPTTVSITANSTVSATIAANTLTLTTALSGTSGGTGKTTVASQALLVGNTTNGYNELTLGADGYVLQSNGTAIIYSTLDGGSF